MSTMVNPMLKEKILRHDANVPRYTSYPTAPHFKPAEGDVAYKDWLHALPEAADLSLYIHVPFCAQMCHYCGCHTKITRHYEPVERYVALLRKEIALLSPELPKSHRISHIHFGGGSPTMLTPNDFDGLMEEMRNHFHITQDAEIAIEADPRQLTEDKIRSWARNGVTRLSLGVQDFDMGVLNAVNRPQSFELSEKGVALLHRYGINRINFDLMYGLPHQTVESITKTAKLAVSLAPDRIALFGYAHVPWMKKHMRLIDESALPDASARYDLNEAASSVLLENGYHPVGIDHFVRQGDNMLTALQNGTLHRNFQGYTTDTADALIGLGVSSIGRLPQGYAQNTQEMPLYRDALAAGKLPTARMCTVSTDDQMRAALIETLMCTLHVTVPDALRENVLQALRPLEQDGLILIDHDCGEITIPGEARTMARMACTAFDTYYQAQSEKRHARAV